MKIPLLVPQDRKLTVIFRVEPGCLGPDGKDRIDAFCGFAQQQTQSVDSHIIVWEFVPRYDKTLPEIQYQVADKKLSREQATKYLDAFGNNIGEFEENLQDRLAVLIDQFRGQ